MNNTIPTEVTHAMVEAGASLIEEYAEEAGAVWLASGPGRNSG